MDENTFDMVIMQLEMPLETIYQTYEMVSERGIPVFLDAGPAMKIPLERLNGKETRFIECFKVDAVDSTAAGDTFGAVLAIRLCKGDEIEDAIHFAHAAAGICVSRMGAQTSIPTEEEVRQFLEERA